MKNRVVPRGKGQINSPSVRPRKIQRMPLSARKTTPVRRRRASIGREVKSLNEPGEIFPRCAQHRAAVGSQIYVCVDSGWLLLFCRSCCAAGPSTETLAEEDNHDVPAILPALVDWGAPAAPASLRAEPDCELLAAADLLSWRSPKKSVTAIVGASVSLYCSVRYG